MADRALQCGSDYSISGRTRRAMIFIEVEKRRNGGLYVLVLTISVQVTCTTVHDNAYNHKNYNFLVCDWFKKVLFSTNSLAKLLSDSLLLDSLLLDSLLSDSLISQSYSKM